MDPKILAELEVKLEKKKLELIEQLESVGHRVEGAEINFDADFPQYGESAEDNATEVADYTKNLSYEKELEENLRGVEKAIKKVGDGTYGRCSHCGQDIEIERLKIRPESTSCVACKNKFKGDS